MRGGGREGLIYIYFSVYVNDLQSHFKSEILALTHYRKETALIVVLFDACFLYLFSHCTGKF